jgi:hypothetical protein
MIDSISGSKDGWLTLTTVVVVCAFGAASAQERSNAIASIKAINAGEAYEVTITSEEPFLRSDLPVLRIGEQEFTLSRAAAPDQHYAQTFILTAQQFAQVKSGDKAAFQWGRGEGRKQLEMGTFDKSKLAK